MWRPALIVCGVLTLALAPALPGQVPAPQPRPAVATGQGPAWAMGLAEGFEAGRPDAGYLRYVSWHGMVVPPQDQQRFLTLASYLLNCTHFASAPVRWREVPGSGGLVWWFDLREPGWTPGAWQAVARRDNLFTDVTVPAVLSERMRARRGLTQDKATLSCEVMVWGPGLLRDLMETDRNGTYYDLLFSGQRFPASSVGTVAPQVRPVVEGVPQFRTERRTVHHAGGDYVYPDDSGRVSKNVPAGTYFVDLQFKVAPLVGPVVEGDPQPRDTPPAKNFPATIDDWDKVFAVKPGLIGAHAFGTPVGRAKGALVAGSTEPGSQRSVIARSNRWVEQDIGQFGWDARTYDVAKAAGKRNFLQQSAELAGKRVKPTFDAGELLATLPAGGIAMLLTDGAGKRLELTDPRVTMPGPPFRGAPHLNFGAVRNGFIDCYRCHLQTDGVISAGDVLRPLFLGDAPPLKLEFDDPAHAVQFRGFLEGLSDREVGYRVPHRQLIQRVTGWYGRPWTGAEVVAAIEDFVAYYDGPVTAYRGGAEFGVSEDRARGLLRQSIEASPAALAAGFPVPRSVWDADVRPLVGKLMLPNAIPVQGVHQ